MSRNFYLEAQVKQAAAAAGALEAALQDFEIDVQTFAITKADEIEAWIAKCKVEKPHRFAIQGDADAEMCHRAFVLKNKTDESKLYLAVGERRYQELKAQWADGIPESEKKRLNGSANHENNPWAAVAGNIRKDGRYTEDAIRRQMSAVRGMGTDSKGGLKAAGIAAAVGARLGQLYAPGFANKLGSVK
jgi:hypothetical protein